MLPFAPRYDPRILELLRLLDDRSEPLAEVSRRVGEAAERLGLRRPSYVHLRRLLLVLRDEEDAARERREAMHELLGEVAGDLVVYRRRIDPYAIAERVADIRAGAPRRRKKR